jgi:hypothetical protein
MSNRDTPTAGRVSGYDARLPVRRMSNECNRFDLAAERATCYSARFTSRLCFSQSTTRRAVRAGSLAITSVDHRQTISSNVRPERISTLASLRHQQQTANPASQTFSTQSALTTVEFFQFILHSRRAMPGMEGFACQCYVSEVGEISAGRRSRCAHAGEYRGVPGIRTIHTMFRQGSISSQRELSNCWSTQRNFFPIALRCVIIEHIGRTANS